MQVKEIKDVLVFGDFAPRQMRKVGSGLNPPLSPKVLLELKRSFPILNSSTSTIFYEIARHFTIKIRQKSSKRQQINPFLDIEITMKKVLGNPTVRMN